MKKIMKGAVTIGVLVALSGCASGGVSDKRAPGEPGHKVFQLQVGDPGLLYPDGQWVTVSEHDWEACSIEEHYPECAVDDDGAPRVASK